MINSTCVNQEGQPGCHPKRATGLSFKKDNWTHFVMSVFPVCN